MSEEPLFNKSVLMVPFTCMHHKLELQRVELLSRPSLGYKKTKKPFPPNCVMMILFTHQCYEKIITPSKRSFKNYNRNPYKESMRISFFSKTVLLVLLIPKLSFAWQNFQADLL